MTEKQVDVVEIEAPQRAVDAFEEVTGAVAFDPPDGVTASYHDEVVLAYHRTVEGERRAKIHVLSFEDVPPSQDRAGPLPGPTSNIRINTSTEMLPDSRIVVRTGDNLVPTQRGPHIVVAYLNLARQVVVEVFKYRHERPDPSMADPRGDDRSLEPVFQFIGSSSLRPSPLSTLHSRDSATQVTRAR